MGKRWKSFLGKVKNVASKCKKELKREIRSWRRVFFNFLIEILIGVVRKSHGSSRPRLRSGPCVGDTVPTLTGVLLVTRSRPSNYFCLFQSEEMVKGGGLRRKVWLGLTSCLLLAGLVLATSGLVTWSLHTGREESFLILLDAGSVHTSVYTYR